MSDPTTPATQTKSQYVDVNGTKFAYRTYGTETPGEPPLVLLHRFRATLDDWDPAFIDALAKDRRVIAFNNRGVGDTEGETPSTLEEAADDAAAFIRAIGVKQADILGWSMGGMTSQILPLRHPELIRRVVLSGTCPPGNPESAPSPDHWMAVATKPAYQDEDILYIFFTKTENSLRLGRESLARMDKPGVAGSSVKSKPETMAAQGAAIGAFWGNEKGWYEKLGQITQPTLVANGDLDVAFPVTDVIVMAREIPNSHIAVYPDAGHGFLFQMPEAFAADVVTFLKN